MEIKKVKKGDVIYKKGDDTEYFVYVIKSGIFKFYTTEYEDSHDPELEKAEMYRLLTRKESGRKKIKRDYQLH